MHSLLYRRLQGLPRPYALARFRLDDGARIVAFESVPERSVRRMAWVAKTAHGVAGIRRLRAEAEALRTLAPEAGRLGTPRLLAWDGGEREADGAACLIQSAIAGRTRPQVWNRAQGWAPLPEATRIAGAWLERLQRDVPAPRPGADAAAAAPSPSILDAAGSVVLETEHDVRRLPSEAPLLRALLPVVISELGRAAPHPVVAVHGDFWPGNVLFAAGAPSAAGMGVVDWSSFSSGTAFEDILNWFAHLEIAPGAGAASMLDRWIEMFFSPGSARAYLQHRMSACAYAEPAARLAFYLYLLRRMRWELGLDLQARSPSERAGARRHWTMVLAWLAQHRYPDPFTPMPVEVRATRVWRRETPPRA